MKLQRGFSLLLQLAMMGCAAVSPGGSRYRHYCHRSHFTSNFSPSAEGRWQRNSSHERIFQPLIAGFKARYPAFLGFKLTSSFSQTCSCFQISFQKSWRRRGDEPFSRYLRAHLDVCPAGPVLQTCNSCREHEPARCALNECWGSSASQEWLKGQFFS